MRLQRTPSLLLAQFLNPTAVLTTSVQWFNLQLDTSASCPQLPKNSWVWIQLAPKAPITLTSGNFYDGVRWLGAQNFLAPVPYTDPLQQPWGIGASLPLRRGGCRVRAAVQLFVLPFPCRRRPPHHVNCDGRRQCQHVRSTRRHR